MISKLKIIPLGGLGEVGKNMTVFEFGSDIIIVDCGMGADQPVSFASCVDERVSSLHPLKKRSSSTSLRLDGSGIGFMPSLP